MDRACEHTVKAFDDDITRLRGLIAEMGGLAEVAIHEAMQALVNGDEELALQVVARDKKIDALESEVDELAVRVIALRAPMADDLREVIAALKIAGVVERIGDYAKNIAKRVGRIEGRHRFEPLTLLPAMAEVAAEMVHDVLTAFAARDPVLAREVIATRRQGRRFLRQHLPQPGQPTWSKIRRRSAARRICCSSPGISSGSAIMRPMSPKWSISPRPASIRLTTAKARHEDRLVKLSCHEPVTILLS